MIGRSVRSLRFKEWPNADREAWERACRPAIKLQKGGSASHLKLVSQRDLADRYGYFLDYIARTSFLDSSAEAGSYVTSGNVDGYLVELKARVSSVTAYGNIHKLRRITQLIAPGKRLEWLREIEQDLDWDKQPASKFNRIVDSDSVVRAGLALMEEAEMAQHLTPLGCARNYRNGLMIALRHANPPEKLLGTHGRQESCQISKHLASHNCCQRNQITPVR